MDTVSMLNNMRFYCQPILPLVYDESMSYYETLCKVVGQLNTTGDAVNKLNEGLTGEIADRQKGDILLDERLRVLEKTNKKIHFLTFAGTPPHNAKPIGTMPTRSELWQWVNNNELIITLLQTTDGERNLVYAASCTYNAGNWASETSDDFNILVPIHTSYDADKDHAISQKVAKITIPPSSTSSLDGDWRLQFIEINTPSTSADGVVNFAANIFQDGHMECNLTPFEFMNLYAPTWANRNLCVAVNAKLFYDGYTRTSSIATLNSSNHIIRIAFERDYGVFENNGVRQLNKEIDYIIGDVSYNTWTHETIDSKTLDFSRYEGFQFTRGENNVITANDESTPNAVYAQYHSDTSGKLYQNLPVRLIDTVDNAEYWNGVFDIKDNRHMTFTFVTSNYATASGKMSVRVIELSADANTTTWKYAEKEFELPFAIDTAMSDTSTNPVQNKVVKAALDGKFDKTGGKIEGNAEITGFLNVGMSAEFSSSIQAQSEITSDLLLMAPIVALRDPATEKSISLGVSGENAAKVTSPVSGGGVQYARLKVASPTEDNDAATKKYVDDHSAGDAITYVDFWPTGSGEQYNGNYNGYQVELATDQTFDAIFDSFNAGNKIVARLYKNADKSELAASSVDSTVTGSKEFGAIHFQFVTADADTDAIAGFPFIGEAIMMMKLGESAIIYLIENRNVLPTPNADGTDNGKVPIINGTKWELKTLPTYANGNEVSY